MSLFFAFLAIIFIFSIIIFSCYVFTNAIEHLGAKLHLGNSATGCVLAAVGTALPETIVPLVAIYGAYVAGTNLETGFQVSMGAILGSPFMLATFAFGFTGLAVLYFVKKFGRSSEILINIPSLTRDFKYFATAFIVAIIAGFLPYSFIKNMAPFILLLIYVLYVYRTIIRSTACEFEAQPDELFFNKYISKSNKVSLSGIIYQLAFSLFLLIISSHFFVEEIKTVSELLSINPMFLSLIISPIATELPEIVNSVFWTKSSKDVLAISNISGAMVFQACIPCAIGVGLTPWNLDLNSLLPISVTLISVGLIYLSLRLTNKLNPYLLIVPFVLYFVNLIRVF